MRTRTKPIVDCCRRLHVRPFVAVRIARVTLGDWAHALRFRVSAAHIANYVDDDVGFAVGE